jgi:SAM-dependent MidA family methyltransferase
MKFNGMTQAELEAERADPGPAKLAGMIRREIEAAGAVSFARFMALALYAPGLGYYERAAAPLGRQGDYYTSVSVGSFFGELLAFQFARWAQAACGLAHGPSLQLVEAGAHDGRLAADVLGWLRRQRPDLFASTDYWLVEPSACRRQWQEKTLAEFGPKVRWSPALASVPRADFQVLFCNELLDALPVRRLGWDAQARTWFEWGVAWDGGRFVWTRIQPGSPDVSSLELSVPSALLSVLPDGYTIEIGSAAEQWWRAAAAWLGAGKLVAIDYGFSGEDWLAPHRPNGTLRAYRSHRYASDPLADPGKQDLTAHVNFEVLQRAGEAAGLKTDALVSQAQFLTGLVAPAWADPASFGPWPPRHTRQFQTLTHPDHLGRAFRVLVQSRPEHPTATARLQTLG